MNDDHVTAVPADFLDAILASPPARNEALTAAARQNRDVVHGDRLTAALSDSRFWLCGDEDGNVDLHCRDCSDGGRPFAHYAPHSPSWNDPKVTNVTTIPDLFEAASHHLTDAHDGEARS